MARKSKFSPEVIKEICSYIRAGLTNKEAALAVGICEDTFYTWIKEKPEFSEPLKKALIERKAVLLSQIMAASKKHWQAAAWYLERAYPKEFGKRVLYGEAGAQESVENKEEVPDELAQAVEELFIKKIKGKAYVPANKD